MAQLSSDVIYGMTQLRCNIYIYTYTYTYCAVGNSDVICWATQFRCNICATQFRCTVIYVLRSSGQDRQSFIEFFIFIPCEKSIFTVQYVYVETMTMTMIMTFFCLGFYPSLIETQALTVHSAS